VLLERLEALDRFKLTLVAAPAGSGKTTLVSAWLRLDQGEKQAAWLSLDRWDNDPVRFWTYLAEALRTVEPDVGAEVLGLLRAPGTRLLEDVVPTLVNELEQLRDRLVLVLDDYHLITTTEIHETLAFLLEHLPPALHLLIATRSDPPLPLAPLRARRELLEIRAADLRFTPEESSAFLNGVLELGLEHEDVDRLHDRTEGWAAGLYLAALSLRGHADPRAFIADFAGDDRHIVDYLGAEVLRSQPQAVRTFMLQTSVLERLSGSLCDAVTGFAGSVTLLSEIESANLFLVALDNRREWYRYHHLFGRLLLHELQQAEPELVATLHRRAAAWYRQEGSVPESIEHLIAAGDTQEAAELIALHWNAFFNHGRLATVAGWLDSLPGDAVEDDPRLCIARGWLALDLGLLDEVERWIEAASRSAREDGHTAGLASLTAEISVLGMVYRFKVGDVGRARQAADETLERAPADALFPRTVAYCILGIAQYWSGDLDQAVETLEKAVGQSRAARNDLAASYALGYLSVIHADRGDTQAAEELASTARHLSDEPGFAEHFVGMMGHLGSARMRLSLGEHDEAEAAASRAHELAQRGAGRLEVAAALLTLAEVRHARGARDDARRLLAESRRALEPCPDARAARQALDATERRLRVTPSRRPKEGARDELTDRELAVLRLLDTNLSQREIGATLYVSLNTVKTHVRGIFRKLDASTRREAVQRARELELL
jgi:LuxR family maltose regulon positive regulatory protein